VNWKEGSGACTRLIKGVVLLQAFLFETFSEVFMPLRMCTGKWMTLALSFLPASLSTVL
ncbi:hypothetical protein JMJ77_0006096, partial [Colletotrichum scovillei]